MNRLRFLAACAGLLAAGLASAQDYQAGALKIVHPWARPTVAGQPTGGGFLKIENTGGSAERLLGGSTPVAEQVQLHSMRMEGDVMRMREVPAIDIAPGQTVELSPGRLHVMLIGLKAPLAAGQSVPLTLKFEKAGEVKVQLKVETAAPAAAPKH